MRHALPTILCLLFGWGCGGAGGAGASSATELGAAEPDEGTTATQMQRHFTDVAHAREAIIRGDVESTSRPFARVASSDYGADAPASWAEQLSEMRSIAAMGAGVEDLRSAAQVVASLAGKCAACHARLGGGASDLPAERPTAGDDLNSRMRVHAWAAEQLWLGLSTPADDAWSRGADAIRSQEITEQTPAELRERLAALAELGERATHATTPERRIDVYGDLIVSCANCHSGADALPSRGETPQHRSTTSPDTGSEDEETPMALPGATEE